ncbi:MAG: carboxypeptidase-like regulatory domain-containing protein [Endomicrobiales bacterium]|nr:carboxypeptidase-like regulatory domain-containing protein [Endomicrobiales bacterium]
MRKITAVLTIFLHVIALCQGAEAFVITGVVRDSVTKEPVKDAVVSVKGSHESVLTDSEGRFEISTGEESVKIICGTQGYRTSELRLSAPYQEAVFELDVSMHYTLGKIYVRDKHRIEGSKQKIRAENIKRTTSQLFSDSLKVVQTLPGVVIGDDFSSLMYIRGGEYYESVSFLDNIHILVPYLWGGAQSIFNPSMVDRIDFYSGGFPAKYPQALSGVIDVASIEGSFDERNGYLDISPTTFEIFAQGPVKKEKSSYVVAARRTYYDLLMNLAYGDKYKDIAFPFFYDLQSKFTWKLSPKDKLFFNTIASYEGMDFDSKAISDNDETRSFEFHYNDVRVLPAVNWEHLASDDLSMNFVFSTRYHRGAYDFANDDVNSTSGQNEYDVYFRDKVTYMASGHTIEQGFYLFRTWVDANVDLNYRTLMPDGTYVYKTETDDFDRTRIGAMGLYLQDDMAIVSDKLYLNAGVLAERFDYTKENTVSPRGGLKYDLTKNTSLKFNTGIYSQFPVQAGRGAPPFLENDNIESEKAVHYVLGVERELPNHLFARVETYIKDYSDMIVRDPDPDIVYTNNGARKASGFDVFVQRKPSEKWDGWLAYTYLDAKDKILERNDPANYADVSSLNYREPVGEWFPFSNERKHNFSVVFNYEFDKIRRLSVTYRYSTGTPYTEIVGAHAYPGGVYVPVYGEHLGSRMPEYHRLDAKLTLPLFNKENTEFYVQVINLTAHKNIDRYYYSSDYSKRYEAQMLPLIPIAGVRHIF